MHWLDTIIVAVLGLGAALGFVSGLFWQLARVACLGLAIAATVFWHDPAAKVLRPWLLRDADASVVEVGAYVAVFLLAYLGLYLVMRVMRMWLRATDLALPDRLLGAGLGAAKMAALAGAGCLLLQHADYAPAHDWLDHARLAPQFAHATQQAVVLLPEKYTNTVAETFRQLQETMMKSKGRVE